MARRALLLCAIIATVSSASWVGTEDGSFRPSWMSFDLNAASEFISSTTDSLVKFGQKSMQRTAKPGMSGGGAMPVSPLVEVLLGKLQHLRVTAIVAGADADALGGLTVDAAWLEASGMFPGQRVEVRRPRALGGADTADGAAASACGAVSILTTIRAGPRDSSVVSLDVGAAAELAGGVADGAPSIGDRLIVAAYGTMTREQYAEFKPRVLLFAASDADEKPDVRGGDGKAPKFRMLHVESENDRLAVQSPPLGEPGAADGTAMQPPPLDTPNVIYQDMPKKKKA